MSKIILTTRKKTMEQLEKTASQKLHSSFSIQGMTCQACVKTITDKLSGIAGIKTVDVSLADKRANIVSERNIGLSEVSSALADSPKYSASEYKAITSTAKSEPTEASLLKTYKPLIAIFSFILLVSISYQISLGVFNTHIFMNHLMAGFFIGLSFFKLLDLKAFSESFSSYDPIAQRWLSYGYIYPFVELGLGLLFISGKLLMLANAGTVIVLSVTTYGVYKRLQSKSQFQCACLGTTFNLPLSNVTIVENVAMIAMALYGLSA